MEREGDRGVSDGDGGGGGGRRGRELRERERERERVALDQKNINSEGRRITSV